MAAAAGTMASLVTSSVNMALRAISVNSSASRRHTTANTLLFICRNTQKPYLQRKIPAG